MAVYGQMRNETVTILMATYNGSAHIENQILSLQQQKYKDWVLYIRDDGSSDNTVEIIKRLQSIDHRIHLVEDEIKGLGPGRNFLSIVKYSRSDYTIYCDQDDIWLENKISEMVKYSDECGVNISNQPSIVYADGYAFFDETGEIDFTGISHNHAKDLAGFLFFNGGYQGCSIMFNQAMVKFLSDYKGMIYLHDDITSLAAHAFGEVHFLPKKLMLYRQHSKAVTGMKKFNDGRFSKLTSGVNYLLSRKHFNVKESFFELYGEELKPKNKDVFNKYIKFCHSQSRILQLKFLIEGRFTLNDSAIKLFIKFILRRKFDS